MSQGNKFGAFKGVFTPSILTILGVIMYLRLPWIVGQAGLLAALGIVLVAHMISASTGLSVASIATDKKVETGGTYYMISRSLGLPIGGTLGLALFVGLSFSVSLYLIGFSETLLNAFNFEVTLNNIRLTGGITLLVITIITFISTSLALKTQFIILAILILSLVSIFLGKHNLTPTEPITGSATSSLPWIALFAIFFPAVTGFEAGVSMSGDLANPRKSIPIGTIMAIVVGLIVYVGLVFFFAYTVERDALINDSAVLLKISYYSPLVVAGIWGATLSSALGSILGAPRILQATAIDRITPKLFAKGVGSGNEPRNALILTFFIALSGILIGELNAIARVVSIFFIITYGFLNLTCAIENWAGTDFRPSFKIPAWVSIIGAVACFVIMIQLDIVAMIGATILLGAIFFFLKQKELRLQSGDTWGGFWSSIVKYGLLKLSNSASRDQRNWRPNIILFSGGANARPHLIEMSRILVGKLGVFTNFELVESSDEKELFAKPASASTETDQLGKKVITRRHSCKDIYEGMQMIAKVYGFTGFEPNTILMGMPLKTKDRAKLFETANSLTKLDYNLVFLNKNKQSNQSKQKQIDLWWNGYSRNLNFGMSLLKYISTDPSWRTSKIRVLVINYNSSRTDTIYALLNQVLNNSRLLGTVKVINNATEQAPEQDIILSESAKSDLTILESKIGQHISSDDWYGYLNWVSEMKGTTMLVESGSAFEVIDAKAEPQSKPNEVELFKDILRSAGDISLPSKEILIEEAKKVIEKLEEYQGGFINNSIKASENAFEALNNEAKSLANKTLVNLERVLNEKDPKERLWQFHKVVSDLSHHTKMLFNQLNEKTLLDTHKSVALAHNAHLANTQKFVNSLPDKLLINFGKPEYKVRLKDSGRVKSFKIRSKLRASLLGWPLVQKVEFRNAAELFLLSNRAIYADDLYRSFGLSSLKFIGAIRRSLVDLNRSIDQLTFKLNNTHEAKELIQNHEWALKTH